MQMIKDAVDMMRNDPKIEGIGQLDSCGKCLETISDVIEAVAKLANEDRLNNGGQRGRELALVKTKLEEAGVWLVAYKFELEGQRDRKFTKE